LTVRLNNDEVLARLRGGEPVVFSGDRLDNEDIEHAVGVLRVCLAEIGQEGLFDQLTFCLRELIDNALKANLKRVIFAAEHLDINADDDYERGMLSFQEKRATEESRYMSLLVGGPLYVEVRFQLQPPLFTIAVINNTPMVEAERRKVLSRQAKAKIHNSIAEVIEEISDDSESAGLGLVMLIMILRKIGVPEENFRFIREDTCTIFSIEVPLALVSDEETERISAALAAEIDSVPQFPKSIMTLGKMLKEPGFDFHKVAVLIRRDPALTMEVLRMANSALYRRFNKIETIELAISILGTRGLEHILQSFGARKALEQRYSPQALERLWEHSSEIAEICSLLCARCGVADEAAEIAYVGGLLHDIGKIILEGRHPTTFKELSRICAEKNISRSAIDDLIEGVNHSLIGARMAEKWNIPERIVELIRSCRTPLSAPEAVRPMAKVIYLAHLVYYQIRHAEKEHEIAENILGEFGLGRNETLEGLAQAARERLEQREP